MQSGRTGLREHSKMNQLFTAGPARQLLLVEDDQDNANLMTRLLSRCGFSVSSAATLGEARGMLAKRRFDFVISDLALPDGSGLDVLSAVPDPPPAIVLSGRTSEADKRASLEAGFRAHLTKPVDFLFLQRTISDLLPCQA
jgi:DNA-binding response OmpR family regulator